MKEEAEINEILDSVVGQPVMGAAYVEEKGVLMVCFPMKSLYFRLDEQTFALDVEAPH